jgi:hypothetical protein
MRLLRSVPFNIGGSAPKPPGIYRFPARMVWLRRRSEPPPAIPAAESALGLRPRIALSSAQVLPEWITSTSPRNDFSSNGDYPLNFLSHWKGSPHLMGFIHFG